MRTSHVIGWAVAICVSVGACSDRGKAAQPKAAGRPELRWQPLRERAETLPISLTASDGSGLALVSIEARAVIEDPLAFTELHLKFHNPEPRRREGRFTITLPPNAAISRFAMRVGSEFQEGEVVERRRAQAVYEDFLHRKQDPALLENAAGNEFSARVFPIEANADKELIIAYSHELAERTTPYALYLKGLPRLATLSVDVRVGSGGGDDPRLKLTEADHAPAGNLVVRMPDPKPVALRSENLVVARVAPVLEVPAANFDGLTVLFDTSASRALGYGAQIERLGALVAELERQSGRGLDLRVIGFDQNSEELFRGPSSDFGLRAKAKLLARDALGASDLARALADLGKSGNPHSRVLVIGDGVITAGADDAAALRESVTKLAAHGLRRLDVLAEGGIQDRATLAMLTRAGLPETGALLDASAPVAELAARLRKGVRDRVQVNIAGAAWVYPDTLEGLQPGDERLVYAELGPDTPVQIELVGAGAEAYETREVPKPLLERAWVRARIESLAAQLRALSPDDVTERARLERVVLELSVRHRVVSDYTALLVLESAADYARFGIEQNALANILRITDDGLSLWDRREVPVLQLAADAEDAPERVRLREGPAERTEGSATAESKGSRGAPAEERARAAPRPAPVSAAAPAPAKKSVHAKSESRSGGGLGSASLAPPPIAAAAPRAAMAERAEPMADLAREAGAPARSTGGGVLAVAPVLEPRPQLRLRSASNLTADEVTRALRGPVAAVARRCFAESSSAAAGQRLAFELSVSDRGRVNDARVSGAGVADPRAQSCFLAGLRGVSFPKPAGASGAVSAELGFAMVPVRPQLAAAPGAAPRPRPAVKIPTPAIADAYTGTLAEVLELVRRGEAQAAVSRAAAARAGDPADVMSLVALGEALEAQGDYARAARAYGSLIDLFPSRADLRRMASARLERLPSDHGLPLAVDSYRRAVQQRPDHPSGHRALAYALLKQGDRAQAFEALERALAQSYVFDRFEGIDRILREDLALVAAAWLRVDPTAESRIRGSLTAHGAKLDRSASTRFVLQWETDANDVDFHIYDGRGGHAYYMQRRLGSGGQLYADITTGYGPECFAITGRAQAYPYVLQAHYFARGPMGYGMGKLQIVQHDGNGNLSFAEHPFVIMKDKAFVELARLSGPLG